MTPTLPEFRPPSAAERFFNRIFSLLVGWGIAPRYAYLLAVPGRRSGRIYSTPVSVLEFGGERFLVAPRGRTQWVRNGEAAGTVLLRRGRLSERLALTAVPDADKPQLLRAYLDRFRSAVQRFFPVPAGSASEAFAPLAANYPVFRLSTPPSAGAQPLAS
jgi:hypothetical protein